MQAVFITYDEAQRLIPFFRRAKKEGPRKEARESAGRILEELRNARPDVDYAPFGGHQIILNDIDYEFLMKVLSLPGMGGE